MAGLAGRGEFLPEMTPLAALPFAEADAPRPMVVALLSPFEEADLSAPAESRFEAPITKSRIIESYISASAE